MAVPAQAWEQHWVAREGAIRHHVGSAGADAIWLVGDSLTEGFWWTSLAGCPLVNVGFGGIAASSLAELMPGISGYGTPRYAVVMIGTNTANLSVPEAEFGSFSVHLETIVEALVARGTKPILVSIPPVDRGLVQADWSQSRIDMMNERVATLAKSRGYQYVDLAPLFKDPVTGNAKEGVTYDGIHLTPSACRQLHAVYTDAIEKALLRDGHLCN